MVAIFALVFGVCQVVLGRQDQLWRGPEYLPVPQAKRFRSPVTSDYLRPVEWLLGALFLGVSLHLASQVWAWVLWREGLASCQVAMWIGTQCDQVWIGPANTWHGTQGVALFVALTVLLGFNSRVRSCVVWPMVCLLLLVATVCMGVDAVFVLPVRHWTTVLASLYNVMSVASAVLGLAFLWVQRVSLWRWLAAALAVPLISLVLLCMAVFTLPLLYGATGMWVMFVFFILAGMPVLLLGWMLTLERQSGVR